MATTRFNGATVTLTNADASAIATDVGITSFSYEGGDRAEIDITTSSATSREIIAGFRNPRRLSLGLLLDTPSIANLDGMMEDCDSGSVTVKAGTDCAASSDILSLDVFLMSYSVSAQLDGVMEVQLELLVDERPTG